MLDLLIKVTWFFTSHCLIYGDGGQKTLRGEIPRRKILNIDFPITNWEETDIKHLRTRQHHMSVMECDINSHVLKGG